MTSNKNPESTMQNLHESTFEKKTTFFENLALGHHGLYSISKKKYRNFPEIKKKVKMRHFLHLWGETSHDGTFQ